MKLIHKTLVILSSVGISLHSLEAKSLECIVDHLKPAEFNLNSPLSFLDRPQEEQEKGLSPYCQKMIVENQGETVLQGFLPKLHECELYTLDSLARHIAKEPHPALALYQIWSQSLIQSNDIHPSGKEPLELLNFIGVCSQEEFVFQFVKLCHQLGIETRPATFHGKDVYDFYCQDEWTLFDLRSGQLYWAWDNQTLVSSEELMDDPFLALRTKVEGKAAQLDVKKAWQKLAHFEIVNPALMQQAPFLTAAEPPQVSEGFDLYPQEKLIYYTPTTRPTLNSLEREVEHVISCQAREFSDGRYRSPFPIKQVRNQSPGAIYLRGQQKVLQPGETFSFEGQAVFHLDLQLPQRATGQIIVTSSCSWRLFPSLKPGMNAFKLEKGESGSRIKLSYEVDETLEKASLPCIQVENTSSLFDFCSPRFQLTSKSDSSIEKIWWQISADPDFTLIPSNFEQIEPFTAEVTLPLLTETFFNSHETYYFRISGYLNGQWSTWSAPFAFTIHKPDPVTLIEFDKIGDNTYELNWEREAVENNDLIEYLVFGSNALDFIPCIYCDKQVNASIDGVVTEEEQNQNLIAVTKEPKIQVDGSLAYYRIIARQQDQLSTPSPLVHIYDHDLIQPRTILQVSEQEEGHQVLKRVMFPPSYPWTEIALPHVDNPSLFENSLLHIHSSLIRATLPLFEAKAYSYNPHVPTAIWEKVRPYFLPENHPARPKLDRIFSETRVIQDPESFRKAGFKRYRPGRQSHIMASSHPDLKNYFIKAFADTELGIKADWYKFIQRIEGARSIRTFIHKHSYQSIFKVPHKWIYPLPAHPSPPNNARYLRKNFILVAENMRILEHDKNEKYYKKKVTRKLLDAIYTLFQEEGLYDSVYAFNIPFCKDGKIAIIDTEYHHKWPVPFHKFTRYLSKDMQQYWETLIRNGGPQAKPH